MLFPPLCLNAESALNESLRMCSSSMNIRISLEDYILKLGGNQEVGLRKGDWIALYPQILHMDPEIYEDPEVKHSAGATHHTSGTLQQPCFL